MSTDAHAAITGSAEREATPVAHGDHGRSAQAPRVDVAPEGPDAAPERGETSLERFRRGLRDGRAPQAMFAAIVAWTITVAPAAFARGAPAAARVTAVLAVVCGAAAPLLAVVRRRLGRHLGISVYLALVTATWLLASPFLQPSRLDPVRAAIGAVAWGVFALSWRDRWGDRRPPASDGDAPELRARAHLPPFAAAIVAFGALASLAFLTLAWRVRDPDRAVFAQAVSVACAVALVSAASSVAVARGRRASTGARRLSQDAIWRLLLLMVFAVLGAVVMILR